MANNFIDNLLSIFPLGYITHLVGIIISAEPVMPPNVTYTFGTSSDEELQGKSYTLDIWGNLYMIDDIQADDGTGKNIWDIVMPYWDFLIAFGVLSVIISDILDFRFTGLGSSGGRNVRAEELYSKSGSVNMSQLPDQADKNKVTYGETQNLRIKVRMGGDGIPSNSKAPFYKSPRFKK